MPRLGSKIAAAVLLAAVLLNLSGCVDLQHPRRDGGTKEANIDPAAEIDPAKEYKLRFWDYRLPVVTEDGSTYDDLVAAAIDAFQSLYPNVAIEYRLLSVIDGKEELEQAIAAGAPPDVYGGLAEPAVIDGKLQVPAGLYLSNAGRTAYSPAALQAVSAAGEIRAWPRWIIPRVWIGNASLLATAEVNAAAVVENGWTRCEFEAAAARLMQDGKKGLYSLLINDASVAAFEDILLNCAAAQRAIVSGGSIWNGTALADTFAWLDGLRRNKAFPVGSTKMQSIILTAYWDGKVMAAGGLGPWLLGKEMEREQRRAGGFLPPTGENDAFATVLLPVPHSAEAASLIPIDVGSIAVFRQSDYRGDDHTRAAAEFAAFFGRETERTIADRLFYLPARLKTAEAWLASVPMSNLNKRIYRQALQCGFAWQACESGKRRPDRKKLGEFGEVLAGFWSGKAGAAAAKAAEKITSGD